MGWSGNRDRPVPGAKGFRPPASTWRSRRVSTARNGAGSRSDNPSLCYHRGHAVRTAVSDVQRHHRKSDGRAEGPGHLVHMREPAATRGVCRVRPN